MPTTAKPKKTALHRSGAVARMLNMPVATLRVWERRYALTDTAWSPSGQRLYADADVRRLALIKQLTDRGHAIGSLAGLGMAQLQRVAATHEHTATVARRSPGPGTGLAPTAPPRPWRLVVVGPALGPRLQAASLRGPAGRPVQLLGPYADLAQAAAAASPRRGQPAADAWLVHQPQLGDGWLAAAVAQVPALAAVPKAVVYSFAPAPVCDALVAAGVALLREPQPDAVLAQWLGHWAAATTSPAVPVADADADRVGPRRWDDATLAGFAARSSTVACECPRHVAELLVQLSHFETYSADCRHRSPADAALHAYLGRVAAGARAGFEAALEHVALHEGLVLPPPSG